MTGEKDKRNKLGELHENFPLSSEEAQKHQRITGEFYNLPVDITNKIGMKFKLIPAGTFLMGHIPDDDFEFDDDLVTEEDKEETLNEMKPVHHVEITKPFYLGIYPVTQEQYIAVMGENPSEFVGSNFPVQNVNWSNANEFCMKMSEMTGDKYRLPSEAEWEYACRAGTDTGNYWGSDDCEYYLWYKDNSGYNIHPIGEKEPNAWGLYDMAGNVLEWCSDWHNSEYYTISPIKDPKGPSKGDYRICRGGWYGFGSEMVSAERNGSLPECNGEGFRVVLEVASS